MDLNQLRVFYHVAKFKSFSLAAQGLFVTRPAVSISIKKLEEQYGLRLFERAGKKIELTNAGAILFGYAEEVFNLIKEADIRIKDLTGTSSGTLKISSGLTIGTYHLPPLINAFRKEYPDVEIQVEVKNKKGVIDDILLLQTDLGFLGNVPDNDNIVAIPLWKEELVVIAPIPHSFGPEPFIQPSQLGGQPFIFREKGSGAREYIESRLKHHRVSIKTVMEIGSDEAIMQAVKVGLGISIVPERVVQKEVKQNLIKTYRVSDERMVLEYSMIRHKDKYISNLIKAFIEMVSRLFSGYSNAEKNAVHESPASASDATRALRSAAKRFKTDNGA
jgi:DNA-binding transcriptional LysR family regulator